MQLNRYTLYGFAAVLLWSATIAIIRSLSEQVGPITSAAFVYLLSGLLSLIPLACSRHRIAQVRAFSLLYLLGCGALFIFYMLAVYLAVGLASDRQQVLEVGLINYLWPALTLLLSVFLLGKSARFPLIPGTLLGFVGAFLVLTQGDTISWTSFMRNMESNLWAYALALMAAVSWALYSNLSRRWGGAMGGNAVPFFMMATGLILLFVCVFFAEQSLWTLRSIAEALFMSLATLFSYMFWDLAMRKGDMVLVAASSYFIPFLSTLVSSLYLGITPGLRLWLGCGCIIVGSLISWASVSDRSPN
ncbi:MAG: aromatic amino acid DMT transporter YddG [Thermodesulfobacteriota bacterium]